MLKIGITGGIGCGKSFVCRKLQGLGMVIFDCDREAKRIMETLPDVVEGLKSVVGEQVYTSEGRIDKRVMSDFLLPMLQMRLLCLQLYIRLWDANS